MKFSNVLLGLPLAVSAAVIDKREVETVETVALPQIQAPPPTLTKIRPDVQRKYFTLSRSFALKGNPNPGAASSGGHSGGGMGGMGGMGMGGMGGMGGEGDSQSFNVMFRGSELCAPCLVLAGQIKITYADGSPANVSNGVYTHHILTYGPRQPGFVSNALATMMGSGFVGAGDDNGNRPFYYTPLDGSFKSGYHVQAADSFNAQIVLVNYNPGPKTVHVHYDLEYTPNLDGIKVKSSLLSASLNVGGMNTNKNRAVNTTSSAMPFTQAGTIVFAKGHLHDGGSAMYLKISGTTNYECVSKATYGGVIHGSTTPTISDMSDCNKSPIKVHVGDRMFMTAEYDLKSHPLRGTTSGGEGGTMGMFRIIFAPS